MRFLGLTLPPLTLIMLLAFLWLILLVLLLWVWLRPRRPLEPPRTPKRATDRATKRDVKRDARLEDDTPAQLPRPRLVREVARDSSSPKSAAEEDDPFEGYNPKNRNDDFDF